MSATTYRQLTDAEFEEEFRPQQNHLDPNASWSGWGYETYGEELDYVCRIASEEPGRVWTVMDDEETGGTVILSGMAFINRLLYIVTEKPAGEHEFISVPDDCERDDESE
jgi:hypothetical protein